MNSHNIRKTEEFEEFIKTIKRGSITHWIIIAKALGVNKDTINEWKKLPEARRAVAEGISYALLKQEETGKNDWRMWRSKLQMLGVKAEENIADELSDKSFAENIIIYKPQKQRIEAEYR